MHILSFSSAEPPLYKNLLRMHLPIFKFRRYTVTQLLRSCWRNPKIYFDLIYNGCSAQFRARYVGEKRRIEIRLPKKKRIQWQRHDGGRTVHETAPAHSAGATLSYVGRNVTDREEGSRTGSSCWAFGFYWVRSALCELCEPSHDRLHTTLPVYRDHIGL